MWRPATADNDGTCNAAAFHLPARYDHDGTLRVASLILTTQRRETARNMRG
jgi:hypothetical protein